MEHMAMNPAEMPKRPSDIDPEIESLVEEVFQETDAPAGEAPVPEKKTIAETSRDLLASIKLSSDQAIEDLLGDGPSLTDEQLISSVIERALQESGMSTNLRISESTISDFVANAELRAKTRGNLVAALNAKMVEAGNDQEKISRLEEALGALE